MSPGAEPQFQLVKSGLGEGFIHPDTVLGEKSIQMLDYGEIAKGINFQLTQYPDGDNLVWIARMYEGEDELKNQLGKIGSNIEKQSLTEIQNERLVYCLSELNLPLFLAVHLALNRPNIDVRKFSNPNKTDFIIVTGDSRSGKSTLVSAMSLKFPDKVEGYSLEFFTSNSGLTYSNYFKSEGLNEDSEPAEILSAVSRFRSMTKEERSSYNSQDEAVENANLSQILDGLLEKCLRGDSKLILIESPGARDDTTVQITHLIRESLEVELRIFQAKPTVDSLLLSTQGDTFEILTDENGQVSPRPCLWLQTEGPGLDIYNLDDVTNLIHEYNDKVQIEAKKLRESIVNKLQNP